MKKFCGLYLLIFLLSLPLVNIGCDYISGKTTNETPTLPRWGWNGIVDGYPIVIDRNTQEPLRDITPDEAFGIIGTSQSSVNPVVIDVRTPQEYADGHIHNAVNMNLNAPDFKGEIDKLDKNKTYIVYCRTGVRSATARNIMEGLGFPHVLNMTGGITDWISQGFPIVK